MNLLNFSIIVFIIMETANVIILYFFPDSRRGNGVAVFKHWERSKADEDTYLFASYMTNWVAGTKLIFILLLITVLFTANELTKVFSVAVMIASIATYYWRLHPIVRRLDQKGQITPSGYSKTLGLMIAGFLTMFSVALVIHILFNYQF